MQVQGDGGGCHRGHRLGVRAPAGMVAEEVYLVSPETAKLLALKESILKETPDAKLFLPPHADETLPTWT